MSALCFAINTNEYGNVRLCDECGAVAAGHIEQLARLGWRTGYMPAGDDYDYTNVCGTCDGKELPGNPLQRAINDQKLEWFREHLWAVLHVCLTKLPKALLRPTGRMVRAEAA